jgi:hypothetical protein
MQLKELTEAMDRLVESDPSTFSDAESILTLQRQLARLEAFVTTATAAFDASGDWAADGAQTCAAWLATRTRLPKRIVRRRIRLGRNLRLLPAVERAWLSGDISEPQAAAVADLRNDATEEFLQRDEELLVEHGRTLRFDHFSRVLAYWALHADPEGSEDRAETQRQDRDAYLDVTFGGMTVGKLTFDPISGAIVSNELERLVDAAFRADWGEAKERLGRDPTVNDLRRSPGQRRADAFVEMAIRSASMPPGARRPEPLFSVYVGYETLHGPICELAQGTVLSPGSLVPWLTEAVIERAVFSPADRVVTSERARLFTGGERRSIQLRDRTCSNEYCDRPAEICEVDHIIPYSAGGPTTQENGRLLCGFHNRLRNQRPPPDAA